MAKGNRPIEVRVDELTRARWQAAALVEEVTLSEWVRRAAERALAKGAEIERNATPVVERAAKVARAALTGQAVEGVRRDLADGFRSDFKPERKKK